MAQRALKTTIVAESGVLLAAMPVPFVASMASIVILVGWVTWKIVENRQSLASMLG